MIDRGTIKTLERLWDEIDAELFNPQFNTECRDALDKALAYVKMMGEIEAAATEISFNGEQFMHKIYKLGGQWSDVTKEEWFASLADAWGRIKEQK